MDARALRKMAAAGFGPRVSGAQSLSAALADGFDEVDRDAVTGVEMVIVAYEVTPGIGGQEQSRIWAVADFGESMRAVKFNDGGRSLNSITRTLKVLQESGIMSNVRVVMDRVTYEFTDQDGIRSEGKRYTFRDPGVEPAEDVDAFTSDWSPSEDEPNF